MNEYAVLYNRSLETLFGEQARKVAAALGDAPCLHTTDLMFLPDDAIRFQKCVYFDKDVIPGLRLEGLGVRLYNNIGSIELCDDKRRTYELLRRDLRIPETVSSPLLFQNDPEFLRDFAERTAQKLGFPLIAKTAYGSLGQQVRLLSSLPELLRTCEEWDGIPYLFQKFIASSRGKDLRVYVVAGKAAAAMERENPNDFRSNIGNGGRGKKVTPPEGYAEAAVDACALLGLDFGGVDLLYGEDGAPYLCEVNSNALFRELNEVCGVRIDREIAAAVQEEAQRDPFPGSLLGF